MLLDRDIETSTLVPVRRHRAGTSENWGMKQRGGWLLGCFFQSKGSEDKKSIFKAAAPEVAG